MSKKAFLLLCGVSVVCQLFQAQDSQTPVFTKQGTANQLVIDGNPYLMLAGELGNSSASSNNYMYPIWSDLADMHVNTLLVPVYWELLEPVEGTYDFILVDSMVYSARKHGLRIVFLWFGTWKNSMSCYTPLWVKINQERFPLARKADGTPVEILTPFSIESRNADQRAFIELMRHIKIIDGKAHTVIMIQVENEIGMIPEARDYCDLANNAYSQLVPQQLMQYLNNHKSTLDPVLIEKWKAQGMKSTGTWEEVFGKGLHTDEFFMAWYFASYTNAIAEAGKAAYPLPMYVNAALIREGYKPGQYPSAGPLPHLVDIWKAAAPAIDFLAPDIYFRNFKEWTARYDLPGNPLFIPEVGNDQPMVQAFYAFAQHNAIGYSPFSIESVATESRHQVTNAYGILQQLSPLILANQGKGTMAGFLLDSANQKVQLQMGNYIFNIRHEYSWSYSNRKKKHTPRVGGLLIQLATDEFIIAGTGIIVTFESVKSEGTLAGIGSLDEGEFINGKWTPGRRMNGDQSHQGRHMHLTGEQYGMQMVRLYTYK
jgi:beta-galactosidase GanA